RSAVDTSIPNARASAGANASPCGVVSGADRTRTSKRLSDDAFIQEIPPRPLIAANPREPSKRSRWRVHPTSAARFGLPRVRARKALALVLRGAGAAAKTTEATSAAATAPDAIRKAGFTNMRILLENATRHSRRGRAQCERRAVLRDGCRPRST